MAELQTKVSCRRSRPSDIVQSAVACIRPSNFVLGTVILYTGILAATKVPLQKEFCVYCVVWGGVARALYNFHQVTNVYGLSCIAVSLQRQHVVTTDRVCPPTCHKCLMQDIYKYYPRSR